jgi:hypothetical protein
MHVEAVINVIYILIQGDICIESWVSDGAGYCTHHHLQRVIPSVEWCQSDSGNSLIFIVVLLF